MPKVPLYNQDGATVGEIDLDDRVFGIEPREAVVHRAVVAYLANQRLGTHDVKNRGEVRGGGRKPWRQKGTGRARQGSIRAPQWVGGGVVFGPTPRSYRLELPKKMRRLALKSVLSAKTKEGALKVLDRLVIEAPKTKAVVRLLKNLSVDRKALVILPEVDRNVLLSARNLPGVKVTTTGEINVYDLLNHDALILTEAAARKIEEVYA
ncbi:50S ribosomal protein L4 [Hydrogenibacillus schlegelii]|uniref:Large ribosomal subunit protein uL4 n=1 Tax=Hydrogenibacillus schlegelii TaxID=1484 RepID=A0A132N388_HYDSH|nr:MULTISPECIES: 50S ribosomal protein L4 [Hydrogenibacillus]KWX04589.1 50S ribosomal protein L4 [Hydrogenibacillus schlegelii]OAR04453.1 50S ribosomal protein L4 [Hydrogenibacillus schlegelii]QZA33127.1 50S ribosomal protein L4 [Hydrogenibacillus sp. N12]